MKTLEHQKEPIPFIRNPTKENLNNELVEYVDIPENSISNQYTEAYINLAETLARVHSRMVQEGFLVNRKNDIEF